MENEMVASPNEAEVVAPDANEVETEIDWKAEAEREKQARIKAEDYGNNQKIRAEKAVFRQEGAKTEIPEAVKGDLSAMDTIAIINAKVPTEDVQEVADYARFKGVPVAKALEMDAVKATLKLRAEQRATASATSTGSSRRASSKVSDEDLIRKAQGGQLPTSEDEIERLVAAKHSKKA